ncbi:LOW QUALITY PROTEIN: hypothetical protein BRADI_1g23526v3 [Brachypodium distachyon]|uniref:DUF2921 domain-containing protein n=1 Tax=Brachypodium distachyon TaxID=15368 RepID=A0A2K2DKS0_BRADI|nr:LOW QUALITY PROTEIN: hypothetical protein BRADI_1g23526v3 [Brachypodium distachyon]
MASSMPFLGVILLCLCITTSSLYFDPSDQIELAHDYLRFADVNRHCHSVVSSAKELTYDSYLPNPNAPRKGARRLPDPLSLATLATTHVEDVSRKSPVPEFGPYPSMSAASPELNISAGRTRIKIVFEGVYTESAKGDGERVLCMVGTALLPKRSGSGSGGNGIDPWGWAKNSGRSSFQPPVMADSNILLLLRYPKELTLTTRAVLGTMGSTSARDAAYFDTVELVAGLTQSNFLYQFRPEELVAGAGLTQLSLRATPPPTSFPTVQGRMCTTGATRATSFGGSGTHRQDRPAWWRAVASRSTSCASSGCACTSRIPTTISITRRDTMLGWITGVDAAGGAAQAAPLLSFQQRMHPPRIWNYHADDGPPSLVKLSYRYSYTKIKRAGELLRRSQSQSDLCKIIVKSMPLSYPRKDGTGYYRRRPIVPRRHTHSLFHDRAKPVPTAGKDRAPNPSLGSLLP